MRHCQPALAVAITAGACTPLGIAERLQLVFFKRFRTDNRFPLFPDALWIANRSNVDARRNSDCAYLSTAASLWGGYYREIRQVRPGRTKAVPGGELLPSNMLQALLKNILAISASIILTPRPSFRHNSLISSINLDFRSSNGSDVSFSVLGGRNASSNFERFSSPGNMLMSSEKWYLNFCCVSQLSIFLFNPAIRSELPVAVDVGGSACSFLNLKSFFRTFLSPPLFFFSAPKLFSKAVARRGCDLIFRTRRLPFVFFAAEGSPASRGLLRICGAPEIVLFTIFPFFTEPAGRSRNLTGKAEFRRCDGGGVAAARAAGGPAFAGAGGETCRPFAARVRIEEPAPRSDAHAREK